MTNVQKLRLFNIEGVEIYAEDMDYIADKSVLYVSKGSFIPNINELIKYDNFSLIIEIHCF